MTKKNEKGQGIKALLNDVVADSFPTVPIKNIIPDPNQPRHYYDDVAMKELDIHLAKLCYQNDAKGKVLKEKVACTGFELSGSGDSAGIKLSGNRTLPNQKSISLSTPKQLINGDFWNYPDMEELEAIIEECKEEVLAYLFEGKHAADNQLELDMAQQN